MRKVNKIAAQGELLFVRCEEDAPEGATQSKSGVVGHSETGHHHVLSGDAHLFDVNPFLAFVDVKGEHADIVHQRAYDTHETLRLPTGKWKVFKQKEYKEGWTRALD